MSQAVSDVQVSVSASAGSSAPAEAPFDLNAGFLGTGSSTMVELAYIAMLLILVYIAHGMYRYYLPDFSISAKIFAALGLRDS